MKFNEIKTLTYIGDKVTIDSIEMKINTTLDSNIDVVQYHRGRNFLLEESANGMKEVPLKKYAHVLDEFLVAKELQNKKPEDDITPQIAISNAIQNHLDTKAQSLRYDNINAIGKYVGYANDFQAEAESLGAWASSCWKVAEQIEVDVQSGARVMPTVDEVLAELPAYQGI